MSDSTVAEIPVAATADDPANRSQIALLPSGHRRAESGHPWIYSNEIVMDAAAKALAPGTLVTLRRADGRPFGVAMFNPHTLIAARLLDRDAAPAAGDDQVTGVGEEADFIEFNDLLGPR
jgi:23S rRNA (cytosine1962-C5)-methyltransferase